MAEQAGEDRLRALLERRKAHTDANGGEVAEWVASLDRLWADVGGWLRPYVDAGLLIWETADVLVDNDDVPAYVARSAAAWDAARSWRVDFTPVGRFVLGGSTGRVDVSHGPTRHMLLRSGSGAGAEWEFHRDRSRGPNGGPGPGELLTREHILDALADALEPWMGLEP